MSDALWAARLGDDLLHTTLLADIVGGVNLVKAGADATLVRALLVPAYQPSPG